MMPAISMLSLAGIQDVRRKDRYSLAARALAAKALGGTLREPLEQPPMDIHEQPGLGRLDLHGSAVVPFLLVTVALPYVLERFDDDHTVGAEDEYYLDDMIDGDPYGDPLRMIIDEHEDAIDRIETAWSQVFRFVEAGWPEIEVLASKLLNGPVSPHDIPTLSWPTPGVVVA